MKKIICKNVLFKPYTSDDLEYQSLKTISILLDQGLKISAAGKSYLQKITIVADLNESEIEKLMQPLTLKLTTDTNELVIVGDLEFKLRLTSFDTEASPQKIILERNSKSKLIFRPN